MNQTIKSDVENIVRETSFEMTALNQEQLYNYGVDANGLKLSPKYSSDSYAKEKNYMNRRPGLGQPDLYLTGAWYKGFNVVVENYSYRIDSTDPKSDKLKSKYGNVFGLTSPNMKIYAHGVFFNSLRALITRKTGLQFS